VDRPLPEDTYERGTLFFKLVEGLPQEPGARFNFNVYFTGSDEVRPITLHVEQPVEIDTPLGRFEVTPILTQGAEPENVMYVTRGEGPRLVRVDVVGLPMHFELVSTDVPPG
jgi:hypothetical protein